MNRRDGLDDGRGRERAARGLDLGSHRWLAALKARRGELQMAALLIVMIVLPSAVLAFFSWRAIENEKLVGQERLERSCQELARMAGRDLDGQLAHVEMRWLAPMDSVLGIQAARPRLDRLETVSRREPLIAASFLLGAPGRLEYPRSLELRADPANVSSHARAGERDLFDRLVTQGEELEYRTRDLPGAIARYGEILERTSDPQLRAIALSDIGRAQMKNAEWERARTTFGRLFEEYPEVRDLNRMYLRFLAQYQTAVALDGQGRVREALDGLVALNQDLLDRSDEITALQYSYYTDLIRSLSARLLSTPGLANHERYDRTLRGLQEHAKKRLSQNYLSRILDAELTEHVVRGRRYTPRTRYISDLAAGDPFLLAYRLLPNGSGVEATGLLAVQIDLEQLKRRLIPDLLRRLDPAEAVTVSIVGEDGNTIIGGTASEARPMAFQRLAEPFDFWRVGVGLEDQGGAIRRMDLRASLWMWLISMLLLSILFGATVFLRRMRRQALVSRAQASFVSSVSHELRTPVASIKMFSELMEMEMETVTPAGATPGHGDESAAGTSQYLRIIRHECDRLGRLVENVLDFSRMDRKVRRYHFERRDLADVLRLVVESFRPHAEVSGFRLDLAIEGRLPELVIDSDAISQVVLNLLSNAVRYSDQVKEIRVRAANEDRSVVIDVTDRGIGIAPREIRKVFDRFYRADRRLDTDRQGGLGLGLTLSQNMVRAHGGEIRVRSELGRGSTFTVVLPVPRAEAAAIPRPVLAREAEGRHVGAQT